MREDEKLTLANIKKSPKFEPKAIRLSDLVTEEERAALRKPKVKKPRFYDDVDAFVAEMIARFGYDVYERWNKGEITTKRISKWIAAERGRDRANWIPVESIICNMVGSCIRRHKKEKVPKGPKKAHDIMKADIKTARGEI